MDDYVSFTISPVESESKLRLTPYSYNEPASVEAELWKEVGTGTLPPSVLARKQKEDAEAIAARELQERVDQEIAKAQINNEIREPPMWMPDSACKTCHSCGDFFSLFRRRHHCRVCGLVFCSSCTSKVVPGRLHGYGKGLVRACDNCYEISKVSEKLKKSKRAASNTKRFRAIHLQQMNLQSIDGNNYGNIISSRSEDDSSSSADVMSVTSSSTEKSSSNFSVDEPTIHLLSSQGNPNQEKFRPPYEQPSQTPVLSLKQSNDENGDDDNSNRNSKDDADDENLDEAFGPSTHSSPSHVPEKENSSQNNIPSNNFERREHDIISDLAEMYLLSAIESTGIQLDKKWSSELVRLAEIACDNISPYRDPGESMSILEKIRVSIIPGGKMHESSIIEGGVIRKNIIHRKMKRQIKNPRIMLLEGALEFQRTEKHVNSLEAVLEQEKEYLELVTRKISSARVDVLLVGGSVSRIAQKLLLARNISVCSHISIRKLEWIARLTGAIVLPSTEYITYEVDPTGTCDLWRLRSFNIGTDVKEEIREARLISQIDDLSFSSPTSSQLQYTPSSLESTSAHATWEDLLNPEARDYKFPSTFPFIPDIDEDDFEDIPPPVTRDHSNILTYMFFEGCPIQVGCTIVIRGACFQDLVVVRAILRRLIRKIWSLKLEHAMLALYGGNFVSNHLFDYQVKSGIKSIINKKQSGLVSETSSMSSARFQQVNTNPAYDEAFEKKHVLKLVDSDSISLGRVWLQSMLQSSPPEVIQQNFFASQDESLADFLLHYCFSPELLNWPGRSGSKTSMMESNYSIVFVHHDMRLRIYVAKLPSASESEMQKILEKQSQPSLYTNEVQPKTIFYPIPILTWSACKHCDSTRSSQLFTQSSVTRLSEHAGALSFAKWLQITFYYSGFTLIPYSSGSSGQMSSHQQCIHSIMHDHIRYFHHDGIVASVQLEHVRLLNLKCMPLLEHDAEWRVRSACARALALYELASELQTSFINRIDTDVDRAADSRRLMRLRTLIVSKFDHLLQSLKTIFSATRIEDIDRKYDAPLLEVNRLQRSLVNSIQEWNHEYVKCLMNPPQYTDHDVTDDKRAMTLMTPLKSRTISSGNIFQFISTAASTFTAPKDSIIKEENSKLERSLSFNSAKLIENPPSVQLSSSLTEFDSSKLSDPNLFATQSEDTRYRITSRTPPPRAYQRGTQSVPPTRMTILETENLPDASSSNSQATSTDSFVNIEIDAASTKPASVTSSPSHSGSVTSYGLSPTGTVASFPTLWKSSTDIRLAEDLPPPVNTKNSSNEVKINETSANTTQKTLDTKYPLLSLTPIELRIGHPSLPVGRDGSFVFVQPNEPSSWIAYALNSSEYERKCLQSFSNLFTPSIRKAVSRIYSSQDNDFDSSESRGIGSESTSKQSNKKMYTKQRKSKLDSLPRSFWLNVLANGMNQDIDNKSENGSVHSSSSSSHDMLLSFDAKKNQDLDSALQAIANESKEFITQNESNLQQDQPVHSLMSKQSSSDDNNNIFTPERDIVLRFFDGSVETPCTFTVRSYYATRFHALRQLSLEDIMMESDDNSSVNSFSSLSNSNSDPLQDVPSTSSKPKPKSTISPERWFIESISRCNEWKPTGGKTLAGFYKTQDDRFIVKSITMEEFEMFESYAESYFAYMHRVLSQQNGFGSFSDLSESGSATPRSNDGQNASILVKYLGIFSVSMRHPAPSSGAEMGYLDLLSSKSNQDDKNVSNSQHPKGAAAATAALFASKNQNSAIPSTYRRVFVVTPNLYWHRPCKLKYDLKGNTRNRYVRNPSVSAVRLDVNFFQEHNGLPLSLIPSAKDMLLRAVISDSQFLASIGVIDYSLLVGIEESEQEEGEGELVVGIIDTLQIYNFKKVIESSVKRVGMIAGQEEPTVISPSKYQARFVASMGKYFIAAPSRTIKMPTNQTQAR